MDCATAKSSELKSKLAGGFSEGVKKVEKRNNVIIDYQSGGVSWGVP